MKNVLIAIIGVILCTFQFTSETHAMESPKVELKQNVRILLEITEGESQTNTFSIVGSEDNVQFDTIANMVAIDDNLVPTILSFKAKLNPQGDSLYTINYTYGFQMPVTTGSAKSKDGEIRSGQMSVPTGTTRSRDGKIQSGRMPVTTGTTRSRYEYKNLGAQGTVTMKIGDKLEILKDPKRSVVLKLERADCINE